MNKKQTYKLLGVLGGMGPLASAYFYEQLTLLTNVNCDADHINMLISSMTRTPDRTSFILGQNKENPLQYLIKDAQMLEKCGVDIIAVTCNTSHYFIDDLFNMILLSNNIQKLQIRIVGSAYKNSEDWNTKSEDNFYYSLLLDFYIIQIRVQYYKIP